MIRHAIYLPLAFLAGQHGFALLAPYLALCVVAQTMIVQRRLNRAAVRPEITSGDIMPVPLPA